MKKSQAAAFFGIALLVVLVVIYFNSEHVSRLQYNIATLFAALFSGLFAYYLSGSLKLTGRLPDWLGGLTVDAAGGLAMALLTILLFLANRPPDGRTIRGTVYKGLPDRPGDPAVNATVSLSGTQTLSTKTGTHGDFVFPDVTDPHPQIIFEYVGSGSKGPVALSRDGKYYLDIPVLKWVTVEPDELTVQRLDTSPAPHGVSIYVIQPTIHRRSEPAALDGLDLVVSINADATITGTPRVSTPRAIPGIREPTQAAWILPVEGKTTITTKLTIPLKGRLAPDELKDVFAVTYRFRAFPPSPGGPT